MSQQAVITAVRARLTDNWDVTRATIRQPNEDFDPDGKPWIELRFPGGMNDRADLGEPSAAMWEEAGAFLCDVYVPQGAGEAPATALADALALIFQGPAFTSSEERRVGNAR